MICLAAVRLGGVEYEARIRVSTSGGDYECDFASHHAWIDGMASPADRLPAMIQDALLEEGCDIFNQGSNADFEYELMRDAQ